MEWLRKNVKVFIIITIVLSIIIYILDDEERNAKKLAKKVQARNDLVYEKIEEYFREEIGEEYIIYAFTGTVYGDKYRAMAYPASYEGTNKANDRYHHLEVDATPEYVDTNYKSNQLRKYINEIYYEKLKTLFGANVVVAVNDGAPFTVKEIKSGRKKANVSGAIYIYGRVESDADREEYREKIWEFVQYMKETNTYSYVDLGIIVVDERILTDEFNGNRELKDDLVRARYEISEEWYPSYNHDDYKERPDDEYRARRRVLMNSIKEKVDRNILHKRLVDVNITDTYKQKGGIYKASYYNSVLYAKIMSAKQWDEKSGSEFIGRTDFDKVSDVEFYSQRY